MKNMRSFWRYIFPVLFGMLIYTSIRLVNDTAAGAKFWERPWQTNAIEIGAVIIVSYILHYTTHRLIRYFQAKQAPVISRRNILKEFAIVWSVILAIIHLTIIPLVALTDDGLQLSDYIIANIIPSLFMLLYFAIMRGNQYLKNYIGQKVLLEKMANDQLQTELKFLKAQYHPHFLFNALNTIYFQMDEDLPGAKKTVERFSELLRYQLYDQQQTVPVSQEISYLRSFIDIQQVRASERLRLTTYFDESLSSQQVYPLLFLPLAENAFKYVGGEYRIDLSARAVDGHIEFSVNNSLPAGSLAEKQNGIGLENLKRRLELLYPGKHQLRTAREGNQYKAVLRLVTSADH